MRANKLESHISVAIRALYMLGDDTNTCPYLVTHANSMEMKTLME